MSGLPDGFVRAGDLGAADLAPGELRAVNLASGERLCIGNYAGGLFAVRDACPHAEFPLSEGALYANGELECCFHGAKFDCRSGAVLRGPAEEPVATYEVWIVDGDVWVRAVADASDKDAAIDQTCGGTAVDNGIGGNATIDLVRRRA